MADLTIPQTTRLSYQGASTVSSQFLDMDESRAFVIVMNSASTTLYMCGSFNYFDLSTTQFNWQIAAGTAFQLPYYAGRLFGIWAGTPGAGGAHITEFLL